MDKTYKYVKYKNQIGGNQNNIDYTGLKQVILEYLNADAKRLSRELEDKQDAIQNNKKVIEEINIDPSILNTKKEDYGFTLYNAYNHLFNHLNLDYPIDTKLFEMMPPKYKNQIQGITTSNLKDLKNVKELQALKKLTCGEWFGDVQKKIKPGDLPDSIEELVFGDFNNTIIEKGALPKNIKRIKCGKLSETEGTFIEDEIPPHVELDFCIQDNKTKTNKTETNKCIII